MSRFEDFQSAVSDRSQSFLSYSADLVEWSANKNIAIAGDVAGFAVTQLRLPVEANGLSSFRDGLKDIYVDLGSSLRGHGKDVVKRFRDVPAEIRDIVVAEEKPVAKAAPRKKKAPAKAKAAKSA